MNIQHKENIVETITIEDLMGLNVQLKKILYPSKLSPVHFHVLLLLRTTPGITPGQIGGKTFLAPSAVSRVTKRLDEAGLIDSKLNKVDKRRVEVYLTEKGTLLLEKIDQRIPEIYR